MILVLRYWLIPQSCPEQFYNRILISKWADRWLVKFDPSKCKSLIISRKCIKPTRQELSLSNVVILSVQFPKHLCICLSCDRSWEHHQIQIVIDKAWKRIGILLYMKYNLGRLSLQTIYFAFHSTIWDNMYEYLMEEVDKIHNEVVKNVTGCTKLVSLADRSRESELGSIEGLLEKT